MNEKGIQKILWQPELKIKDSLFDVLIPLPANADICLKEIGIDEFEGNGEKWDDEFLLILKTLMKEDESSIEIYDPFEGLRNKGKKWLGKWLNKFSATEKNKKLKLTTFEEALNFSFYIRDLSVKIKHGMKEIHLTQSHSIFWLKGFKKEEIEALNYPLKKTNNPGLVKLF